MDTPKNEMTAQRLQELVDAYGVQPTRWPQAERQAAKTWLVQNPDVAQSVMRPADILDKSLDANISDISDTSFLQARILKAAQKVEQDAIIGTVAANDGAQTLAQSSLLTSWKSVAATLALATGLGFGIGQVAAADTNYASAEALLSVSTQSGYDELDLSGEGL